MPEYRDKDCPGLDDRSRAAAAPRPTGPITASESKGAEYLWIAVMGSRHGPLWGVFAKVSRVTQAQVAATIARLIGEDFVASKPQLGTSVAGNLPASRAPSPSK